MDAVEISRHTAQAEDCQIEERLARRRAAAEALREFVTTGFTETRHYWYRRPEPGEPAHILPRDTNGLEL
jgi:hypothetical protein